jgi:hypothetical protein
MASATTVQENDVLFTGGSTTPVRMDPTPPGGRYWVRIVNPHATLRLFVGHSSGTTNNTSCESIDPFNGVWEDNIGPGVNIFIIGEAGYPTNLNIRIKQYA